MVNRNKFRSFCFVFIAAAFLVSLWPFSRADAQDGVGAYESAKKRLAALNSSESQLSRRDCWLSVIESFGTVYLEYPTHERADDSVYMVGILYGRLYKRSWKKQDINKGVEAFKRLIRDYPKSTLADDALYEIAETTRGDLKDPKRAYCWYRLIVTSYPKGDMVSKAKGRIDELKGYAAACDCEAVTGGVVLNDKTPYDGNKTGDAVRILGVRSFNSTDHTRVVLDVSAAADFSHGRVKDDTKEEGSSLIYIDIPRCVLGPGISDRSSVSGGTIKTIEINTKSNPLRVLLSPNSSASYKVFPLKEPNRIVIDIYGSDWGDARPDTVATGTDTYVPSKNSGSEAIKVVVIDPGHGGKDPGAVGPTGYYEKTANLKIALYLKEYLEKDLGLTVIMTRTGDTFMDLKKRTAVANDKGANLFISIHNNASKSRTPYGISTYYLAITSDTKALTVAARENNTSVEKLSELDYILTDLVVSAKRNESSLLAKFVQEGMVDSVKKKYDTINSIGVCQGPFWVLVGAQMPSILVECSYISNTREEKRLMSDDYLKSLARGIFTGVQRYIKETSSVRAGR
ncbi:MAG: N-acetylmuramoyl-L-alanine amidase [Deltaproteobacteria bacterium]|nr:N-acetylmuramoyl-L-alanine amidase [Candidatus Zymogenaceae bacterium]